KIYFYQLHTNINLTTKIGDNNKEFKNIVERDLIDLGIENVECFDIIIEFDDIKYSVKEQISDIVHNTIEITDL
ncbi:MAG: hypothetical protein RLZZ614_639, partial [Bacteroidota bacterium]